MPDVKLGPRYRVITELGAGGMGVVLLALREAAQGWRPVALKVLHGHLAHDHDAVAGLVDEARIASRLHHPNVVRVLDVEVTDGATVLVLDYVEGATLSALLRGLRAKGEEMPVPIVRRILVDALSGLHAAHELRAPDGELLGVVHRDVSPQNVLVGADGTARVTDFGIALSIGRVAFTRESGAVKGKLGYLSPEQVYRKAVDRRADVFAAGCVAWECLVGRQLFQGASEGETLAMVVREPIDPPSAHRFDVPLELDEICLRALERNADRRFATAEELAGALAREGPLGSRDEVRALVEREFGAPLAARRDRLTAALAEAVARASAIAPRPEAPTAPAPASHRDRAALGRWALPLGLVLAGCLIGGSVTWRMAKTAVGTPDPSVAVGGPALAEPPASATPAAPSEPDTRPAVARGEDVDPAPAAPPPPPVGMDPSARRKAPRKAAAPRPREPREAPALGADAAAPRPFMPDRP